MKKKKKTIADIINIAAKTKSVHDYLDYQEITGSELKKLQEKTGLKFDVICRTITTDDIRHAIKEHENDDCPLEYENILLLPLIISEYDIIKPGHLTKQQKLQAIIYEKEIGDKYFVVEEIRTGRKKLAFKTMYKQKIKKRQ